VRESPTTSRRSRDGKRWEDSDAECPILNVSRECETWEIPNHERGILKDEAVRMVWAFAFAVPCWIVDILPGCHLSETSATPATEPNADARKNGTRRRRLVAARTVRDKGESPPCCRLRFLRDYLRRRRATIKPHTPNNPQMAIVDGSGMQTVSRLCFLVLPNINEIHDFDAKARPSLPSEATNNVSSPHPKG
jgi:hypothetical protein